METKIKAVLKTVLVCILSSAIGSTNAQSVNMQETIPLWHGTIPDGPGPTGAEIISKKGSVTEISVPRLIVHIPEHPNGTAILVISGGGYVYLDQGKESGPTANWLQSQGIVAFELIYRLPGEGWATPDVPFEDGQRAIRLMRSVAHRLGFSEHKIGILGFSAGGHLAAMTATQPNKKLYSPIDAIDSLDARPDFAALIYPVITMLPPYNQTHSRKVLLGDSPSLEQEKMYSAELFVNEKTPPTFLTQALDDPIAPVANSKLMYAALQKYNTSSELHLFETGGHGWGLGTEGAPVREWPKLFEAWAIMNGFW